MNAQNLFRLIRNNEAAPSFDLSNWDCGTFGCLVGNDFIAINRRREMDRVWPMLLAMYEYEITEREALFLFDNVDMRRGKYGIKFDQFGDPMDGDERPCHDRQAALSRVRKFLYYKLHKQEMLYDEHGCIRETARRQEGNWNVLAKVKAEVVGGIREQATV